MMWNSYDVSNNIEGQNMVSRTPDSLSENIFLGIIFETDQDMPLTPVLCKCFNECFRAHKYVHDTPIGSFNTNFCQRDGGT